MEDKKREHGGRNAATLIVSVGLILGCSSASSVIDPYEATGTIYRVNPYETTGTISRASQPISKTPSIPKIECPGLEIRPSASTLNIAAKPAQATSADLHYQLSIGQTARECRLHDGVISIKVGVQGHIVRDPIGTSGSVDVPLHYAVVMEGREPKVIATKSKRIRATIAPGKTHVQFVDVEGNLNFALPPRAELAAYVIYVGFDEIGGKNEKNPASATKKSTVLNKQR
jgi:hypothetical protein